MTATISVAAMSGDIQAVEELLAEGEDINDHHLESCEYTLLFMACISKEMPDQRDRTAMIKYLLEKGATAAFPTLQHFAQVCSRINPDQIRLLVEHGADPNARSGDDFVPLGHAVHHENQPLEVCRVLMSLGACPFALCRGDSGIAIVDVATHSAKKDARLRPAADLLRAVCNAGSWHRYTVEPSVNLFALRYLSLAGRAVPPPHLVRLFGSPRPTAATGCASRTRARRLRRIDPPPTEVFGLILEFWDGNRT